MSPEWIAVYITVIGGVGTAVNVWFMLIIKNMILKLQVWCGDEFVRKEDMGLHLGPLRQSIQVLQSERKYARR